ncbi:MAG: magnesium protoporphyrin IX methyltransferase [Pseudomonadota bacterium]
MTLSTTYKERRGELATYFDRTAADAWAKLTSDAPVSKIRATVRAGRDAMRATLLDWLPEDLTGRRILDAGCGPGQLSLEAAARGADVVAVDLSPSLLRLAEERAACLDFPGRITFHSGDMLDPSHGSFDHVVAMDSVIHYRADDLVAVLSSLAGRAHNSVLFTVAPRTPLLSVMHAAGSLFPRGDKSPAIEPISPANLTKRISQSTDLRGWRVDRSQRITSGFYISQAMELTKR